MEKMAVVIGSMIVPFIIGLFVFTLAGFVFNVYRVGILRREMDTNRKKTRKKSGGGIRPIEGGYTEAPDVYQFEENKEYLNKFNQIQLNYSMFEQLVPIFPLLGILGTVAGLIQQLGNVDQMKEALNVSMGTTFCGLLAAIILRLIDAFWCSRVVNDMVLSFDIFERNYQIAKDKRDSESDTEV